MIRLACLLAIPAGAVVLVAEVWSRAATIIPALTTR